MLKGPRQTGKSSLLARGLEQARLQGSRVVYTDLQVVLDAAFVAGSTLLTTLTKDGRRTLWDAERGQRVTAGPVLSGRGCNGRLRSGDAAQLVSEGSGEIRLWAAAAASPPGWSLRTPSPTLAARFSVDGRRLVAACRDGVARVLPVSPEGRPALSLRHGTGLRFAAFNPQGSRIVTTGDEGTVRLWDARTGAPVAAALRHGSGVTLAAFSPDGRRLATVSRAEDVQVWDLATGRKLIPTQSLGCPIKSVWFSADGDRLFALNSTQDLYTGVAPGPLSAVPSQRRLRRASPWSTDPGALLACVDAGGRVQTWDPRNSRAYGAAVMNGPGALCAALDPTGTHLATGGTDLTARLWDVATGKSLCAPLRHGSPVAGVAFSADGTQLATLTADGAARVWETATGDPLTSPLRGRRYPGEVRFSPSGDRLLVTRENGDAQAWDLTPDLRPAADLAQLAQVLAGQRIEGGAGLTPAAEGDEPSAFHRLRNRYPAQFLPVGAQEDAALLASAGEAENSLAWAAAARDLGTLISRKPQDRGLLLRRARARCELSHWKGAADDYSRALRCGADDRVTWYQLALTRLLCDEPEGYRQVCERMLNRFEHAREARDRDLVAWTCALAPLPATTQERALRVIDDLLRSAPENVDWLQTRAFLLYRAGRAPEGLVALEQSWRARGNDGKAPDQLLAALIQARLGLRTEALRACERGAVAEEGATPADHHLLWDERGELILFGREAASALRSFPAQSAP